MVEVDHGVLLQQEVQEQIQIVDLMVVLEDLVVVEIYFVHQLLLHQDQLEQEIHLL
jgi:hypothetical protein